MPQNIISVAKNIVAYILISIVTLSMLKGIVQYYPLRDNVGFLQFKQGYLNIWWWKIAFYTHVFTIIFALIAGFSQFSNYLLRHHKKVHRLIGKIYIYDVLLVNFPFTMILAIYANGLLTGKTAFVVLDCLWFWFTLKAVTEIRKGNIKDHRNYMIRSYALTLSAVMLRCWKIVISSVITIDPLHLYMIDAWMGFVPNLLFAEWLIRRKLSIVVAEKYINTGRLRPQISPQSK